MSVSSTIHVLSLTETDAHPTEVVHPFRCKKCGRQIGTIGEDRNTLYMGSLYVRDKTKLFCSACNTKNTWFPQAVFDKQNQLTDSSSV
jgi:hypothetical protein